MPQLQHLPADADAEMIVAAVKKDGAVVLDDVISPEFVAALREETDPYMDHTSNGKDSFTGYKTTRTGGLMVRSAKCRDLIEHATILNPCRMYLAPYCERVQLHLSQIIRIRPGETAQTIHRDRWAWGAHLAHVEPDEKGRQLYGVQHEMDAEMLAEMSSKAVFQGYTPEQIALLAAHYARPQ